MSDTGTAYEAQCDILADLWVEYKSEPEFKDFVEYNDLGLPLAYSIANGSKVLHRRNIRNTVRSFKDRRHWV